MQSDDADTASSFSILNDLTGQPALLMRVSMPRDIYREGLSTARQMLGFTFAVLLLFVGGTFFAIHRVALRRLSRLSARLIRIGSRGGDQERLPMRGNDEISQVAQAVNAMLDDLDQAFAQRRSASERQRELNALLVRIATDDEMAKGDTAALFRIMSSSLSAGTSLVGWSLWLSSADGQSFDCLRSTTTQQATAISAQSLQDVLIRHDNGLPDHLPYPAASGVHGLILPFHVDSHLGALCVEVSSPQALENTDEVAFLVAATQLIERTLRTHFQNLREQDLRQRAEIDTLTGLANRSMFEIALQKTLNLAQHSGAIIGLLFIDLDRFKPINDSHGHAAGDWLLRQVAERLRAQVRNDDLVARLGGATSSPSSSTACTPPKTPAGWPRKSARPWPNPTLTLAPCCTAAPASAWPGRHCTATALPNWSRPPTWRCTPPSSAGAATGYAPRQHTPASNNMPAARPECTTPPEGGVGGNGAGAAYLLAIFFSSSSRSSRRRILPTLVVGSVSRNSMALGIL